MNCMFIYKKHTKQINNIINIMFHQQYHQYAQLYIICDISINNPEKIEIYDLFTGEFIFSQKLTDTTKALYFCNKNIKINSNEIIYINSQNNKILNNKIPEIFANQLNIYSIRHSIIKHLPRYLEISHQYIINEKGIDVLNKDIISHEFENGIGYRRISFQQIDTQYIKSLIQHMIFSSESIEIQCSLQYANIRIGYIIIINKVKYRILFIYHNFLKQITVLKCHIYIEQISFNFCDSKHIKSCIKKLNSIEIVTPDITENHYYMSITPNIHYLFNINDTI